MGQRPEQTRQQRRHTDGKETSEMTLRSIGHRGIGSRNNEIATTRLCRWPKFRTLATPDAGEDGEKQECEYGWECKMAQSLWKTVCRFPKD